MNLHRLKNKIVTKIIKIASRIIPINVKQKPSGVIALRDLRGKSGVSYYEVNAPYISKLDLSQKFIEDCSSYNKPMLSVEYPGDYVVCLKGGRIYNVDAGNIAIITEDNLLIDELSFQWRGGEKLAPAKENSIFELKLFNPPHSYAGNVFSLLSGGGAVDYYYHWVIDSIAKIYLLKQTGNFSYIDYFVVPNYAHKFQKEYLNYFGIQENKIINANEIRHVEAENLWLTSYVRIMAHLPKWVPNLLYQSFITSPNDKRDKLIYIARGDAAVNRKVLNEAELIEMLKKMDVEIYFLSKMSIVDQAHLFNSAKLVVASHGGGLTNLAFCEAGTKVLEFFPDNYVNH